MSGSDPHMSKLWNYIKPDMHCIVGISFMMIYLIGIIYLYLVIANKILTNKVKSSCFSHILGKPYTTLLPTLIER
jgi:biotin transporter BioY